MPRGISRSDPCPLYAHIQTKHDCLGDFVRRLKILLAESGCVSVTSSHPISFQLPPKFYNMRAIHNAEIKVRTENSSHTFHQVPSDWVNAFTGSPLRLAENTSWQIVTIEFQAPMAPQRSGNGPCSVPLTKNTPFCSLCHQKLIDLRGFGFHRLELLFSIYPIEWVPAAAQTSDRLGMMFL